MYTYSIAYYNFPQKVYLFSEIILCFIIILFFVLFCFHPVEMVTIYPFTFLSFFVQKLTLNNKHARKIFRGVVLSVTSVKHNSALEWWDCANAHKKCENFRSIKNKTELFWLNCMFYCVNHLQSDATIHRENTQGVIQCSRQLWPLTCPQNETHTFPPMYRNSNI